MPYEASGPVLQQRPITSSVPLNVGIGAVVAAIPNAGYGVIAQQMDPLGPLINSGMAAFLNIIAQPMKNIKGLDQNTWLAPILLVIAFIVGYFLVFGGEANKAFLNAATSTITAIANYKADKAAGTNILQPAYGPAKLQDTEGIRRAVRF